jgi:hypothetical protein
VKLVRARRWRGEIQDCMRVVLLLGFLARLA